MWHEYHWFGGMWPFPFMMILIFGFLLYLIFKPKDSGSPPPKAETALEILQKRYASGEIDREEYKQIKKDISEG